MSDDNHASLGLNSQLAHEMRSFISAALLGVELIEVSGDAQARAKAAALVRRNMMALSNLIDQSSGTNRQQPQQDAGRSAGPRPGTRVLVVEDEYLLAQTVAEHLESMGCVVIGPVGSIEDALNLLSESVLDCAVVDANLGGQFSLPIIEALTARGIRAAILSGYDPSAVPPAFRGLPFLQKPLSSPQLLKVVEALCS